MPTQPYARRVVDEDLDALLPALPAVLLDGPKGVGKTATALERAKTVRRLDEDKVRAIVEAEPALVVEGAPPVLIDEWQRVPATWDTVKRAVDHSSRGGQFLMTGSAPPPGTAIHSGAGRITPLRMWPMTLPERGVSTPSVSLKRLLSGARTRVEGRCALTLVAYTNEILASGFPAIRRLTGRAHRAALDGYLERIVERDVSDAGLKLRRPATLKAWLRAYASAISTTASWETIRDAATSGHGDKPAKTTTIPYVDTLSRLRIIDEVPAWDPGSNHIAKLTKAAKHHLTDPALAARLLGIGAAQLLAGEDDAVRVPHDGPYLGALFESLATLTVRVFAQAAEASVFHFRDFKGAHEVDLIVERDDGKIFAFEVKLASAVTRDAFGHLQWMSDRLGARMIGGGVLHTGPEAYRDKSGFFVVPLGLLGP